jgi:cysteinyl-tRNA synthetase
MDLYIYNTIKHKKERFDPLHPGRVQIYVCGPTVYDSCHIGHARSVVVFDVIVRYLRACGYDVVYVRNFTDVDDKIINRANELGVTPQSLADQYIKEFYADMDALNVERANFEPKVTDHIGDIINVIQQLIEKGFAYQVDGDIFFSVTSHNGYGKLSKRSLADMEAGARVDIDKRKKNPFDFVLWKSSKPNEPFWESPWGKGRPGWHIECSAMSAKFLGETFDIHGGGKDLIFPHHENEIAQSEAAHGKEFARYWIHNGFVNIHQEKMSKSLGNFRMIKDVIQQYHPEAIRLFLLSKQYRKPIDFNQTTLRESGLALDRVYALMDRIEKLLGPLPKMNETGSKRGIYWEKFCEGMNDDFNTASGIAVVFDAVRHANRLLDETGENQGADERSTLKGIQRQLFDIGNVLGLFQENAEDYFTGQKASAVEKRSIDTQKVQQMINARNGARKDKDWKTADRIRDELLAMNIVLEDRPDGTVWKIEEVKE